MIDLDRHLKAVLEATEEAPTTPDEGQKLPTLRRRPTVALDPATKELMILLAAVVHEHGVTATGLGGRPVKVLAVPLRVLAAVRAEIRLSESVEPNMVTLTVDA